MVRSSRVSCSEYSFPAVQGQHERIGMVRLLVVGLTDETGALVRYSEDWHLD